MENGIMLQYFHWYSQNDGSFWNQLKSEAEKLAAIGVNSVWLPPAYKANAGANSVGYDVYDIYDLGEFDQKGTVRTKYGTKEEYIDAINECHKWGIQVYVDVTVNHMAGGDQTETVTVVKVNEENRNEPVSEPYEIEAFTKFTFPGRQGKYSEFIWDKSCFTGVDYDARNNESGVFSIQNEHGGDWENMITDEKGNYDYLMYSDIEFRNKAVREELKRWVKWYYDTVNFDGMRLDAVKHIPYQFYNEFLDFVRNEIKNDCFVVGEYWAPGQLDLLLAYIDATGERMSLFDSALHHNLHSASKSGKDFDLRTILDNSLTKAKPHLSVPVVENHDTQPLQALEEPVEPWFKPLAYALILLRQEGYPCVFYTDIYGATYIDKGNDGNDHEIFMPQTDKIFELLNARRGFAYGEQQDYFDDANCIGWVRQGVEDIPNSGCAVMMSNGEGGNKYMHMGNWFAGATFYDLLGNNPAEITIDETGGAEFFCNPGSVSVWVKKVL